MRDAAATKAPLAKTADRVSGIFVPTVICIAAATFVIWLLLGQTFTFALARGISVLVISCPCALGLATPVAIMVGSGVGAKNGILFKTAASLETTGYTDAVLLDKTGTVTTGEPSVVKIFGTRNVPEKFLLSMAAGLELRSEHPLARAILQRAEKDHLSYATVTDFEAAAAGDARTLAVLNDWINEIAQGLAGLVHIFNPQLILIGGGVSAQQALLIDPLAAQVRKSIMPAFAEGLELKAAALRNDAGLVGAVYYFKQQQ